MSYRSTLFKESKSPSEMIHGRQLRNQLDVSISKTRRRFEQPSASKFMKDQLVWMRKVLKAIGSKLYLVETKVGNVIRHQKQLKFRLQSQHVEDGFILEFEKPEALDLARSIQISNPTPLRRLVRLEEKRRLHSEGAGN
ncbi:hypothetical protein RF11_01386 [Thelohanellus kitauei]|uniref:Uncharacterized protein n=1 Tax=Thelohanellus kitauei TaxID=669202 RepID=A0A0C2MWV9_THEKT|nr:hypothetical protein RF11_01386 [Thelohanellus kitauei]